VIRLLRTLVASVALAGMLPVILPGTAWVHAAEPATKTKKVVKKPAAHARPKARARGRQQPSQAELDDARAATSRVTARALTPAARARAERADLAQLPASPLPPAMALALHREHIPLSSVSALVIRLDNGQTALTFNENKSMTPASTMKVVTSYAGLSMLGPDFRWQTSAFADGNLDAAGTLHGNLYIEGTGDPKLVPEQLTDLVDQVRRAGITRIDGDLVLDKGYFDLSTRDAPPFDSAVSAPYNVGPDPLAYAYKSLTIDITPEDNGSATINIQPALSQLRVDNTIRTNRGVCRGASAATPQITNGQDGTLNLHFAGALSTRCGPQQVNIAVLDHTRFFAGGFLALWAQAGGSFGGTVREAAIPVAARRIAVHYSPPLSDVIRDMNKFSNNLMARNLYLTIGAVAFKPPATLDGASKMITRWLRRTHIETNGLAIENGSGLSRDATITAKTMGELLASAYGSPVAQPLIESLPTVGVDGTMRRRLTNSDITGHAQIKTGTLNNVRAIAGYVFAANGHPYAVVSYINDPRSSAGRAAHDALLDWVYDQPPG
jgi:D-alanyl-D-alanine carboxypeptidase/D-alanyl-D-alanine-endopeptidase (penicillin-binding protein 4)